MVKVSEVKVPVVLKIKGPEGPAGFVGFIFGLIGFCVAGIVGVFTVGFFETICLAVFCGILACLLGLVVGNLWTIWRRK